MPADQAPVPRVEERIRRDIIGGVLTSGTRITETALATKYGISRVPIREALRVLEAEGFVESRPYAGCTIASIPMEEADDLFVIRKAIETATARRAAHRAAQQLASGEPDTAWWADRKELATILAQGDRAIATGDLGLLPGLNARFHLGIAEMSGSTSLKALLRQIAGKIEWLYASDVGHRGKDAWSEHRTIMSAIDAGQPQEAERLMGGHVQQSRLGYLSRFTSRDDLDQIDVELTNTAEITSTTKHVPH